LHVYRGMQIELIAQEDDNFKLVGVAPVTAPVVETETPVVEVPVEVVPVYAPKPAPIENQRGLDWFNGTSWGNS
jgi:hypothetical protein